MKGQTLKWAFVGCALLLAAGMFSPCLAQTTYGSIVGTARDPSGAVIPGVQVIVRNLGTDAQVSQPTNTVGAYSFTALFPGRYAIHAQMKGFQSVDITGIDLHINQTIRFDLTMKLGQVSQRVTVKAAAIPLSTDTSDVGQVVTSTVVTDLPLNGREFVQLAALTNDVFLTGSQGGESAGPQFESQGTRDNSNSFLIGGVETRIVRNSTYAVSPSVDAIGEFKVMQNNFSAEYGRGATIVTASIKNGTNQFHGDIYEFLRNDALDARYSFNFSGKTQPLRQNQFGASLGGPIRKNKLFFFANYEGQRIKVSNVSNVLEPTAAQLGGDLSTMAAVATDPNTGQPFPGNIIPQNRISQFAQAGAQFFTRPTGSPLAGSNLSAFTGETTRNDEGIARIDYYLNDSNRFYGFLTMVDYSDLSPAPNPYAGSQSSRKAKPTVGAEYTHIFSPTFMNNVHFGYYQDVLLEGQDKTATTNLAGTIFGLQNTNPDTFAYAPPTMYISGFQQAGANEWQPTGATDIDTQLNEMVTLTRGHHLVKMGADLRWLQYDDLGWAVQNGAFTFNGGYTGNPMADFLLGLPSFAHVAQRGSGDYPYQLRWGEYSFFGQDDIKLTPELTVNAGLRWEIVQYPLEVHNEFDNWDFKTMTMLYAGKTMPRRVLPTPLGNFEPRLGFAYSPKWLSKTVFRGGFSIEHGDFRQYESGLQHFQPPYVDESFLSNNYPTPTFTTATMFPVAVTSCCAGVDLTQVTINYLRDKSVPKYYEYNFNIQRELPDAFVLEVGYVGTKGVNLPYRFDPNQASPFDPNNPLPLQQRVPYPTLGFVSANASNEYSSYNALNVHVQRSFSNGLELIAAYNWEKDLEMRSYDNYTVLDQNNLRLNYGPVQPAQHAVISYIYQLPFGPGKPLLGKAHGALGQVVGGWQVNGITTLSSGWPLSASSSIDNGMGSRAGNMADATGLPANLSSGRTQARWFNTAAFQDIPYTRLGNAGQGTIIGPHSINFDLSFFKDIKFTEAKQLQFRIEMFNAFNHVNLGNPVTNVTSQAQFGAIYSAAAARIVQVAAKLYF
jgi:Carboxypeptidase regulatory-like domain